MTDQRGVAWGEYSAALTQEHHLTGDALEAAEMDFKAGWDAAMKASQS